MIWGQPHRDVRGMAPACRGWIVPVFTAGSEDKLAPCSQIDLARAITPAVEAGAKVINISGGQLTASGESDRLLRNAIRFCQENKVLMVAGSRQ
jgi:subtilisin family serine protease